VDDIMNFYFIDDIVPGYLQ